MQTVKIYGASDDLIEIEGVKGGDEFNAGNKTLSGTFNLGGKMRIHAIYDGCWAFALGQVDEDIPLPEWPIRIGSSGYSAVVEIDVPDDVKLFRES